MRTTTSPLPVLSTILTALLCVMGSGCDGEALEHEDLDLEQLDLEQLDERPGPSSEAFRSASCGLVPVSASQWRIVNTSVSPNTGQWVIRELDFCADADCNEVLAGTAIDSGASESWSVAANAFDNDNSTMWKTFDTDVIGQSWIGLTLDAPVSVAGLYIKTDNVVYSVDAFDVQYYDQANASWVTSEALTNVPAASELNYALEVPELDLGPCGCEDACGGQSASGCWCDEACEQYGDCCGDYAPQCVAPPPDSCSGSCGGQAPAGCWCDDACVQYGDCCTDIANTCS